MLKGKAPLVISLVLALVAGLVATLSFKQLEHEYVHKWNLVEALVAGQTIEAGTLITQNMLATRLIPEQFKTSSLVRPEDARYLENQRILVTVQPGDTILWSEFDSTKTERLS